MSKLSIILISVVLLAVIVGRWYFQPSQSPNLGNAEANKDSDFYQSTPGTLTTVAAPFQGESVDELNNKLNNNIHTSLTPATQAERLQLIEALAAIDPKAAMAQAMQLQGDAGTQAVSAVLAIWGEKDPAGAWNWVQTTHPEAMDQFNQLLEIFGRTNPDVAAHYVTNLVDQHPELAQEIYLAALKGIAKGGAYESARQLVETATVSSEDRLVLANYVAELWAVSEPQAAAQWLVNQSGDDSPANAMAGIGESWSNVDPAGAANFAAKLSEGPQRELLLQQSLSKWLTADPKAATTWLASARNHRDFDETIRTLVTQPEMVMGKTDVALSWSEHIYDPNLHLGALQAILNELKVTDPKAAADYIQSAPNLSEQQRAQLLDSLTN